MDTIFRKMQRRDSEVAALAADIWRTGGLVAFPTETVYGLGGNGLDPAACKKIYEAKGRPTDNPLILHIAEMEQLEELVSEINPQAEAVMEAFWPGPLTLIFPKSKLVPYAATSGLETVAIRMPSHPLAHQLLKEVYLPIAAPSANSSSRPSPTSAAHVAADLNGKIEMIVDGGDVGIGVESTILDLTGEHPVLLRPGFITVEMIEEVLGPIDTDQAVFCKASETVRPKAPGMKYRHYAPEAEMMIVDGENEDVVSYINKQLADKPNLRIGIMATTENIGRYQGGFVLNVGSRNSLAEVAHNLFRVLRQFDELRVDYIYSECFPVKGEGLAVMNRLLKAAGHHVLHV